jgi:flagellar hook-length control protein FliK
MMMSLAGTKNKPETGKQAEALKGKSLKDEKDVSKEGFDAAMLLQAQLQTQPQVTQPKVQAQQSQEQSYAKALEAKGAQGKAELLGGGQAKNLVNAKTTGSMDKTTVFAGLNPWSRDWVFEGMIDEGTAPRPLFESKSAEQPQLLNGTAAQIQQQLQGIEGMLGARESEAMSQAQQPKITRGETEVAADAKNPLSPQAVMPNDGNNVLRMQLQTTPAVSKTAVLDSSSLSGGDYLSTLAAIRGGAEQKQAGQFDGGEQGFGRQQQGALGFNEAGLNPKQAGAGTKGTEGFESIEEKKSSSASRGPDESVLNLINPHGSQHLSTPVAGPRVEVAGHVTLGPMSQERLSSESLLGVSSGIRNLTQQGGGEIHVRLKPENLGELHLRVVTDGRQVGLHIQATDERARKILEDSLGHLKENLAVHNLHLGAVDVSVAQAGSAFASGFDLGQGDQGQKNSQMQQQAQNFSGFGSGDLSNTNSGGQGSQGRSGLWSGNEGNSSSGYGSADVSGTGLSSAVANGRYSQRVANGRLDVRA